ncbi:hypothetical protein G7Z17_g12156 [Cylindrodendrum hubeiense]|uniref:F-box domain-containing protein n=1 Tax=Cylindrodendrum hubeiense TaxID=595255 RepID=A0A9P5L5R3_9HYPO|nr:hypothetical protein G7Z17_g12156 [Cylindrodendrum hubeiense]
MMEYDPMRVSGLQRLMAPPLRRHVGYSGKENRTIDDLKPKDPFNVLPFEVLSKVVVMLSSRDVLHFKLASPVLATMVLPESFWRSRFLPGREFSHIYESTLSTSIAGSWRSLYDRTRSFDVSMMNRKRVWGLTASIGQLLNQRLGSMVCFGHALDSLFVHREMHGSDIWTTAISDLHEARKAFPQGSRELWRRQISLPKSFQVMDVSYVILEQKKYISGLQFTPQSGEIIELGYPHPQQKARIHWPIIEDGIFGFRLAIDDRGIRGIAVYYSSRWLSAWVGDYVGVPKRNLLIPTAKNSPRPFVGRLYAGFDIPEIETPGNGILIIGTQDDEIPDNEIPENEIPENEIPDNEISDDETLSIEVSDNESDNNEAHEEPNNEGSDNERSINAGSQGDTTTSEASDVDTTDGESSIDSNSYQPSRTPPSSHEYRDLQLWYPDVPDQSLKFVGPEHRRIRHRKETEPYMVLLFGGRDGQHLPHFQTNRGQDVKFPARFEEDPIFSEVLAPGEDTIVGIYGVHSYDMHLHNLGLITADLSSRQ